MCILFLPFSFSIMCSFIFLSGMFLYCLNGVSAKYLPYFMQLKYQFHYAVLLSASNWLGLLC